MAKIVANRHKLVEDEILRRSSQILSVVKDRAYIFGGELRPREPRDNDVHAVLLSGSKLNRFKCRRNTLDTCASSQVFRLNNMNIIQTTTSLYWNLRPLSHLPLVLALQHAH